MAQAREKETLKSLTQCKKKERAGTFSGYFRYCFLSLSSRTSHDMAPFDFLCLYIQLPGYPHGGPGPTLWYINAGICGSDMGENAETVP